MHSTHLVAFQEEIENTSFEYIHVSVPKTKSRKINANEVPVTIRYVDAKKEPPQFNNQNKPSFTYEIKNYFLCVICKMLLIS